MHELHLYFNKSVIIFILYAIDSVVQILPVMIFCEFVYN